MAKITKAMQIAEYCENLRKELGIEEASYDFDSWSTLYINDMGLFRFYDEKSTYAFYDYTKNVSADCARRLGERQYKKSMGEGLAAVRFSGNISEDSIWKFMNGKTVKIPRLYSTCIKYFPIKKSEMFRHYDVTDDGLIELDLTEGESGSFDLKFDDLPKTGFVQLPLRLRLSGGLPTGPIDFKMVEYRHTPAMEFECGGKEYSFLIFTSSSYDVKVSVDKWRARKDDEGTYVDAIVSFDFDGFRRW